MEIVNSVHKMVPRLSSICWLALRTYGYPIMIIKELITFQTNYLPSLVSSMIPTWAMSGLRGITISMGVRLTKKLSKVSSLSSFKMLTVVHSLELAAL